jgi:hypothetical protein
VMPYFEDCCETTLNGTVLTAAGAQDTQGFFSTEPFLDVYLQSKIRSTLPSF